MQLCFSDIFPDFYLYPSPSIITIVNSRKMRSTRHEALVGEKNAYKLLVRKPEGWRPLGRSRRSWANNIKIDLGELVWDGADWIGLDQNRDKRRVLMNVIMNLRVP
jgi:hypothetical protein